MSEDDYDSIVAAPNINRQADDEPSARSVEGAINLLSVNDAAEPEDRHPERWVASFLRFGLPLWIRFQSCMQGLACDSSCL